MEVSVPCDQACPCYIKLSGFSDREVGGFGEGYTKPSLRSAGSTTLNFSLALPRTNVEANGKKGNALINQSKWTGPSIKDGLDDFDTESVTTGSEVKDGYCQRLSMLVLAFGAAVGRHGLASAALGAVADTGLIVSVEHGTVYLMVLTLLGPVVCRRRLADLLVHVSIINMIQHFTTPGNID
nr:related to microcin e492 precursor [imported] - Neurospora crassa [Neurospora crassa]